MPPENLPVHGGYQSEGPALADKPVPEKWIRMGIAQEKGSGLELALFVRVK